MTIRLNARQAQQYGLKAPRKPSARERYDGYRSSWERDYAADAVLDRLHGGCPRLTIAYEAITLRLADKVSYTPDFLVTHGPLGHMYFIEVKGWRRPLGMAKVRMAAKQFPMFTFYLASKVNGLWEYEEVR